MKDLRTKMIKENFPGYEDCGHFERVVYNGVSTTLTFIHRPGTEKYVVVSSLKDKPKMVKALTKDEGNLLWKAIKSSAYDLGKALDRLPANCTLRNKFVGA